MPGDAISIISGVAHALSRSLVLFGILRVGNVAGLSLITQEVYLITYLTRYMELLVLYQGLADTVGKLLRIVTALAIVLLIRYSRCAHTYEAALDVVPRTVLLVPPFACALVFTNYLMIIQVFHQFSWYLEPLALLPQFVLLAKRAKQGPYPGWVLTFCALAGVEGIASNWDLLRDMQATLADDPYSLYAAWLLCAVLAGGAAALVLCRLQAKQPPTTMNESAVKPAFNEEWQASKFVFDGSAGGPSSAQAGAGSGQAAGGPPV